MTNQNQRDSHDQEPAFIISVAARMVGLHAQTLRSYERIGLIIPGRSQGNIRFYSRENIDRLLHIKSLLELGVNLAGVEMILKVSEQMAEMQSTIRALQQEVNRLSIGQQQLLLSQPKDEEEREA